MDFRNSVIIDCCCNDNSVLRLSQELNCEIIRCNWNIFSDGEIDLCYDKLDNIIGKNVIVYQSLHCPHEHFFKVFMLLKIIQKYFPKNVYLVSPYVGYIRSHEHVILELLFDFLFFYFMVKKIIIIDPHHNDLFYCEKYKNKIVTVNNYDIFVPEMREIIDSLIDKEICFISPDEGANDKNETYSKIFNTFAIPSKKDRKDGKVSIKIQKERTITKNVFIVDDIIDTGETINSLIVEILKRRHDVNIYLFCTHGLFSKSPQFINIKNLKNIFITNSLPICYNNKKITICDIVKTIASTIKML